MERPSFFIGASKSFLLPHHTKKYNRNIDNESQDWLWAFIPKSGKQSIILVHIWKFWEIDLFVFFVSPPCNCIFFRSWRSQEELLVFLFPPPCFRNPYVKLLSVRTRNWPIWSASALAFVRWNGGGGEKLKLSDLVYFYMLITWKIKYEPWTFQQCLVVNEELTHRIKTCKYIVKL